MIIYIILVALSIATSGIFTYFFKLYEKWYLILLMVFAIVAIYIVYFALYMALAGIISLFSTSRKKEVKKPRKLHLFIVRQTIFFLLRYARAKVVTSGLDKIPDGRVMVICNHQSNFDPMPLMYYIKPKSLVAVTKPENINIFIYGKYMHNMGFIQMPKKNDVEAVKAIIKASNYIKKDITSVLIFPEGKRNFTDTLLDFHPGSFKIATHAKCPIVVTSLYGTNMIKENYPFHKTIVHLDVIDVLNYDDYKDLNTVELAEKCKTMIANKLNEYKK